MFVKETISVTLTPQQAETLALVAKRLGYADLREIASSNNETYRMGFALALLRQRLAEAGIDVR